MLPWRRGPAPNPPASRCALAVLGGLAWALTVSAHGGDLGRRPTPPPAATPIADRFPRTEFVLQEGDIILAGTFTIVALTISRGAILAGPYCHTALFYRQDDGAGRVLAMGPEGLESLRPDEFFARYDLLALVRPVGPGMAPARLGAVARTFWAENRTAPFRFDAVCRKTGPADRSFFCNELVSYIYLQAGGPDPFVHGAGVGPSRWSDWVLCHTGVDLLQAVSPNAVLGAPGADLLGHGDAGEQVPAGAAGGDYHPEFHGVVHLLPPDGQWPFHGPMCVIAYLSLCPCGR